MKLSDLYGDCEKCKKSRKTTFSFIFIMISAALTGMSTSVIFWIIGEYVGLSIEDMEMRGMKLTTLMGATAFLWWVLWQFDNMLCTCDEEKMENWMGIE